MMVAHRSVGVMPCKYCDGGVIDVSRTAEHSVGGDVKVRTEGIGLVSYGKVLLVQRF